MSYTIVAHFAKRVPSTALCQLDSGTCTNCLGTHKHTFVHIHTHTHTHIYLSGISAFWAGGFLRKFYNRPKWTFLEGKCSLFTAEG